MRALVTFKLRRRCYHLALVWMEISNNTSFFDLPVEGFDKENDLDYLDDLDDLDDSEEGRATKRRRGEASTDLILVENGEQNLDDEEEESRQVRLMVGMDDTLDFEVRSYLIEPIP
jgi:hypothetical protein